MAQTDLRAKIITRTTPFIGAGGSAVGILLAFSRIGTESHWETALRSIGVGLAFGAAAAIVLFIAVRVIEIAAGDDR